MRNGVPVGDAAEATDTKTAERVARNDATFRDANEKIREAAEHYELVDRIPFICECADERCREIIQLGRSEYEDVRRDPRWFLNAPGHHVAAQGWALVVDDRGEYVIVEKIGRAGEIAANLDGRVRMDERERKIGLNEAVFREVNERLGDLNRTFSVITEQLQVVCECGDGTCVEQFAISPEDYKRVRSDPLLFVVVPGHEEPDVEYAVDARDAYLVIRKREERGVDELAEATAPE